jgi:hypothetical protein
MFECGVDRRGWKLTPDTVSTSQLKPWLEARCERPRFQPPSLAKLLTASQQATNPFSGIWVKRKEKTFGKIAQKKATSRRDYAPRTILASLN